MYEGATMQEDSLDQRAAQALLPGKEVEITGPRRGNNVVTVEGVTPLAHIEARRHALEHGYDPERTFVGSDRVGNVLYQERSGLFVVENEVPPEDDGRQLWTGPEIADSIQDQLGTDVPLVYNTETASESSGSGRRVLRVAAGLGIAILGYLSTGCAGTGIKPGDYDPNVWRNEGAYDHTADAWREFADNFTSWDRVVYIPGNFAGLVTASANDTLEVAVLGLTSPVWYTEEKLRGLGDAKQTSTAGAAVANNRGLIRNAIRSTSDSIPGGRTFNTAVRRTFNFHYDNDHISEVFPISIVTNLVAADYRATWNKDDPVRSILEGTAKTAVRVTSTGALLNIIFGGSGGSGSGGSGSGGPQGPVDGPKPPGPITP
jgi:hypothetical protein